MLLIAGICLFTRDFLDYKVTGYLLLVVLLLAIFLEIYPVLLAAVLSALALDFLFIKPYYTLHINNTEDFLLLMLFFVIAMINAVLTYKIRKTEQLAQVREARIKTMQLYNTLLDSLSHELRTPISTIIGAVGTMQENRNLSETNKSSCFQRWKRRRCGSTTKWKTCSTCRGSNRVTSSPRWIGAMSMNLFIMWSKTCPKNCNTTKS